MIAFVRSYSIMPGKTPDAVAVAHKIKKHAKEKHGFEINLIMPIGGNPNRIASSRRPLAWRSSRAIWTRWRRTPNGRSSLPATPAMSFRALSTTRSGGTSERAGDAGLERSSLCFEAETARAERPWAGVFASKPLPPVSNRNPRGSPSRVFRACVRTLAVSQKSRIFGQKQLRQNS
jgi:hypothetical protein